LHNRRHFEDTTRTDEWHAPVKASMPKPSRLKEGRRDAMKDSLTNSEFKRLASPETSPANGKGRIMPCAHNKQQRPRRVEQCQKTR